MKSGFTVIELCVCLFIIGIISSTILCSVQFARERARTIQCQNVQRQAMIALHSVMGSKRNFPGLITGFEGRGARGILREILPALEVFTDAHKVFGEDCGPGFPPGNAGLPVRCPSDWVNIGTNVRFNIGDSVFLWKDRSAREATGTGAFPGNPAALADFKDGLSNTCALSERPIGIENQHSRSRSLSIIVAWSDITTAQVIANSNLTSDVHYDLSGQLALYGTLKHLGYNHCATPNAAREDILFSDQKNYCASSGFGLITARSLHSNGVNCTMMDGSARFISNAIDAIVWRAIGTRSGGESVAIE